jgi:hypothetical protein
MKTVSLFEEVGSFAEDKDKAASIRNEVILPELKANRSIAIDFTGITLVTQSFIHALISQALREKGEKALKMISFKNCTPLAKGIIETVVQYVLESIEEEKQPNQARATKP